ncbi:MAG: phosphatidylserine decarboxylase family protein [Chlorobi bacterium]|nr:phosphatidylserine decarboxylase family protein [Chlorobiota bacterium]
MKISKLHKEGYRIILWSFLMVLGINLAVDALIPYKWIQWTVLFVSVLLFLMIVYFFRFPERRAEGLPNEVVAPVDGVVVVVEEVFEPEFFKDKRLQISIFMSPFNVHSIRYPVDGKVIYSRYYKGKHLVAYHPKSSELNERTTVVIDNPLIGPVMYRQVAGIIARRIVNYAKVGMEVKKGEDAGFIKFGSRVDVFLPPDTEVYVVIGDKTRGGETVLGKVPVKKPSASVPEKETAETSES